MDTKLLLYDVAVTNQYHYICCRAAIFKNNGSISTVMLCAVCCALPVEYAMSQQVHISYQITALCSSGQLRTHFFSIEFAATRWLNAYQVDIINQLGKSCKQYSSVHQCSYVTFFSRESIIDRAKFV